MKPVSVRRASRSCRELRAGTVRIRPKSDERRRDWRDGSCGARVKPRGWMRAPLLGYSSERRSGAPPPHLGLAIRGACRQQCRRSRRRKEGLLADDLQQPRAALVGQHKLQSAVGQRRDRPVPGSTRQEEPRADEEAKCPRRTHGACQPGRHG